VTIPELSEEQGTALLSSIIPHLVAEEPEAARALVHAVSELPLGLVLVGHSLQVHHASGQPRRMRAALERLQQREARLEVALPQVPAAPHPSLPAGTPLSLQSSIGLSDAALSQEAQAMLRALAVFPPKPNTFSEDAALVVSAGTPATLDTLVDAGLVESVGAGRYCVHQTIVDYALLFGPQVEARQRFVTWAVEWSETHHQQTSLIEQELPILLEALRWAEAAPLPAILIRGAHALFDCLWICGLYAPGENLLLGMRAAAITLADQEALITSWRWLGCIAERRGDYAQAETAFLTGLELARQGGRHQQEQSLLMALGNVRKICGDPSQARRFLEAGAALARQSGDTVTLASLLVSLGAMVGDAGQLEQADKYYQEALGLAQIDHSYHATILALQGLGLRASRRGEVKRAEQYLREALALAHTVGERAQVCRLLLSLGVLYLDQARYPQAEAALRESLEGARVIGYRETLCGAQLNLSELLYRLRRIKEAETLLDEAVGLAREMNNSCWLCGCLNLLGAVALQQGQLRQASESLQEGIALAQAAQNRWALSYLLSNWGTLQLARQQGEEAERAFH
jgi:tetratricopeptide (TPR) repeat protein